jgi:hypothetical protein
VVPYLSYPVVMDTVTAVENVEVTWRGRVHRTPKGYLVPGRTDRGVLFAVIIGDGEIVKAEGGDRPRKYHYLYVHMHPDRFGGLIPETERAVVDREVLEDALVVHETLFHKSAYRSGIEARMPPENHFHLRAGVWLLVKSRSFPGPGMRKRRYDDGRELTTFPDGRQRMKHPDGLVVVDFPDGGKETRYPDGRTTFRDLSGNLQTQHPDGREVWEMASGNRTALYPDGRRVHEDTSGTVRRVFPDGMERSVFADGTRHVRYPSVNHFISLVSQR